MSILKLVLFGLMVFSPARSTASNFTYPPNTVPPKVFDTVPEPPTSPWRAALVTMAPGQIYWERFGHNAILIANQNSGETWMYNFGIFDFEQKGFLTNFIQGRMQYRLAVFDLQSDLSNYAAEGRAVWLDELNLSEAKILALKSKLDENAKPENANYRYDYYTANCSTKVRDVLDQIFEGEIKRASEVRSRGASYRSLSLSLAATEPWLALAIDLGLGQNADRSINLWQEGFLPMQLRAQLLAQSRRQNEVKIGSALFKSSSELLPNQQAKESHRVINFFLNSTWGTLTFGLLGLALGYALIRANSHARTQLAQADAHTCARLTFKCAAILQSMIGLIGCVLLYLWLGTDHLIAHRNESLSVFNPLALLLVAPLWRGHLASGTSPLALRIAQFLALFATIGLLAKLSLAFPQDNLRWLVLLLPWHWAVFMILRKSADSRL